MSPGSLECFVNETIDKNALTVTAYYEGSSEKTAHRGFQNLSQDTFSAAGTYSVTVTYTENEVEATAKLSVTVKDKLTAFRLWKTPKKNTICTTSVDKSALTVTAHYAAGGDVTLSSSDFTVSPAEFTGEPGPQTVTVTYQGQTATFTVEVNAPGYRITGDGDTYEVHTTEGLLAWNETVQSNLSLNCTLTKDINMMDKEWTPIGNSFQTYNGTFDGQGHSITD